MRFTLISLLAGIAAVNASVCFDFGDCLLTPSATCSKTSGALLGSCATAGPTATTSLIATTTTPVGPATTTGAICFDDGDCILSGGTCVRSGTGIQITGNCVKSS